MGLPRFLLQAIFFYNLVVTDKVLTLTWTEAGDPETCTLLLVDRLCPSRRRTLARLAGCRSLVGNEI